MYTCIYLYQPQYLVINRYICAVAHSVIISGSIRASSHLSHSQSIISETCFAHLFLMERTTRFSINLAFYTFSGQPWQSLLLNGTDKDLTIQQFTCSLCSIHVLVNTKGEMCREERQYPAVFL